MEPRIIKAASINEQETDERCRVAENYSNSNLSIARATVKPGVTTVPHHLKGVDEFYLIARGKRYSQNRQTQANKGGRRRHRFHTCMDNAADNKHGKNGIGFLLHLHATLHSGLLSRR